MKGQFWLAVNIKLKWIFHVHPADVFAFVRNCSWEHHNLSLTRSSHENFLDLSTHVCFIKHFVTFIKDEHLQFIQIQISFLAKRKNSSWRSNDDMWCIDSLDYLGMIMVWLSTKEHFLPQAGEIFRESVEFLFDLVCQLSCVAKNQCWSCSWIFI